MSDSKKTAADGMRVLAKKNFQIVADSRGFTLVEIIMVVVLLSILAVNFLPKLVDTSYFSLEAGAAMAVADIRYTQELAMGTYSPKTIDFPNVVGGATYYTVDSRTVNLPSRVKIPNGSGATFTFNSLGEPTAGGGSSVTLSAGTQSKTITVGSYTGRVSSS